MVSIDVIVVRMHVAQAASTVNAIGMDVTRVDSDVSPDWAHADSFGVSAEAVRADAERDDVGRHGVRVGRDSGDVGRDSGDVGA